VGAIFSAPVETGPWAHPASFTMGTGSFPGVKSGRGVTLSPHSIVVLWSRKGRAIPLLPLWAVRPVQSLSACTRVQFFSPILCIFRIVDRNYICNIRTKYIYTVKYMYYYQRRPTCFGAYCAIFRENFIVCSKLLLVRFEHTIKFSLKMAQ